MCEHILSIIQIFQPNTVNKQHVNHMKKGKHISYKHLKSDDEGHGARKTTNKDPQFIS